MTTFKKFFAAATAVASVGILSMASLSASATEIVPAEAAPYTVYMSIQAGAEQAWAPDAGASVSVPGDGTYTLEYTFTQGSGTVEAVIIDSNINAYSFAPENTTDPIAEGTVKMSVTGVTLTRAAGGTETIAYNGPSNGAFRTSDNGTCVRYNVLNTWTNPSVADIDSTFPGDGAGEGDVLSVTFDISGLGISGGGDGGATTTTTAGGAGGGATTTTTKAAASANNNNSSSAGGSSANAGTTASTSTVSQTADAGVVAIIVGAAAAASLAAGAMTFKKRRK